MKNIFLTLTLLLVSLSGFSQNNGEPMALGLPGDNLNLYAVLDIFQKSPTLEDFERAINDKSKNINNLDLNNDRNIDYLRIVSHQVSNTHTIVIQDPINANQNQDVAVIEVSKEPSGKVFIQIIGDEDLYGKNYIIEPSDLQGGTPNPGYNNSGYNNAGYNNGYENQYHPVNDWLIVNFLFAPTYVVYHSPYNWGYYPVYWHPWVPVFYENYWGYNRHYYGNVYYRRSIEVRSPVYYSHYAARRSFSPIVIENGRRGGYRETYNGHQYRNFGNEDHHENGTPKYNNDHHDNGAPRGNDNHNNNGNDHHDNGMPRGNDNHNNPGNDHNNPGGVPNGNNNHNTTGNDHQNNGGVPNGNNQHNGQNPTTNPTPATPAAPNHTIQNPKPLTPSNPANPNQGNGAYGPRPTNNPRPMNNNNGGMPRNAAPATPRPMNNAAPRSVTPRPAAPKPVSAPREAGRR